jgi:hypothetical protein
MNHCNHGPSRFYRASRGFTTTGEYRFVYPLTIRVDWRDILCATPETTATCATNTRNCN